MSETNLIFSEESLKKVNEVISKMEGNTFHNHYHILYDICNFLNKKNITYLEIGTYAGGSSSLVSMNENVSKIYSIDIGCPIKKEIPIKNVNKFKCETYINLPGGKSLYNKKYFHSNGIKLEFISSNLISKTSFLDILFRYPKDEIISLLNQYSLT